MAVINVAQPQPFSFEAFPERDAAQVPEPSTIEQLPVDPAERRKVLREGVETVREEAEEKANFFDNFPKRDSPVSEKIAAVGQAGTRSWSRIDQRRRSPCWQNL